VDKDYEVFLQGSYGNDTNIYAESDVDVVISLNSTFYKDLENLSEPQRVAYDAAYGPATYEYAEFKNDVVERLRDAFDAAVKPSNNAVKIKESGNRRNADVLVAAQFRRYYKFVSLTDQQYDHGICFWNGSGRRVENYPRQHSKNCTAKHQATSSWFKPTVRIFKNMRTKLVDDGVIAKDLAPSYYVEGLLYNVPPEHFGGSYEGTFVNCFNWINEADRSKFVCANEQYYLLRNDPDVTWSASKCDTFLGALRDLWTQW
jgi:hypothetical protein